MTTVLLLSQVPEPCKQAVVQRHSKQATSDTNTTFSGMLGTDGVGDTLNLTETGTGTQTLTGYSPYMGDTIVTAGTINVSGLDALLGGDISVSGVGTLTGDGTVISAAFGSGGTLSLGLQNLTVGTGEYPGAITFESGSNFTAEIGFDYLGPTQPCQCLGQFDGRQSVAVMGRPTWNPEHLRPLVANDADSTTTGAFCKPT